LFPAYEAYCRATNRGDEAGLQALLTRIWKHLLGDEMDPGQIDEELVRCMQLVPREDDRSWIDEQAGAEDAASAALYALRSLRDGDPQEAAWAARRAHEFANFHVSRQLGIKIREQVLAHPVVQTELARQSRDVESLSAQGQDPFGLVAKLREQARADGRRGSLD